MPNRILPVISIQSSDTLRVLPQSNLTCLTHQMRYFLVITIISGACSLPSIAGDEQEHLLQVFPQQVYLSGRDASQGLLITETAEQGLQRDKTRDAIYQSQDEAVCVVQSDGRIKVVGDGHTTVQVQAAGQTLLVPVTVSETQSSSSVYFATDVVPILTRHGCNSSSCHGKAEGQNGFRLSVFGFDPQADYEAIVQASRGRRVSLAAPANSLLLTKASGTMPHGGGRRLTPGHRAYEVVHNWIDQGAHQSTDHPVVTQVAVEPKQRLLAFESQQQLRVIASWSDGVVRDVTELARFHSNDEALATVDEDGLIHVGHVPGHVAIMASFLNQMDVTSILIPSPTVIDADDRQSAESQTIPIDRFIGRRLQQLNIRPSPPTDDATFLRRVSLDITGTLPTVSETRQFLSDTSPQKRSRLVDELLGRQEYAAYWALKWSDLLRVDR